MDYEIKLREPAANPYAFLIRDGVAKDLRLASCFNLPALTDAERLEIANFAMQAVNDAWEDTALYQRLKKEGKL